MRWYDPSRIYKCIDTELASISDDYTEFFTTGISEFSFYHGADICMIVPEISNFASCSDIDIISDDRITDVREMWYRCPLSDIGIFALDECSYL